VGTVDYDETRVRDVNIKVTGWIEKLHVDYLGAEVETGQPLFDVYAPDLFEAQEQYLLEYRKKDAPGVPSRGVNLLEAARTRLEYYDITPEQIRQLEETGASSKAMTIHSPHRGVVIAKHANEGMRVDEGMQVYRVADLSTVWVMVTLYEYQLPFVQAGQRAIMTLPYIPGQEFEGKIIYVYPYLDATTRQVSVRLEFDNPYANVELRSTLVGERALAPRSAILDTGARQIAFVSLGEGRFEPRDVHVGVETVGGNVEILDGLRPGEMIVTSGQFLLDSETTIRESLAKMIRGTMASEQEAVVAVTGISELTSLPPQVTSSLSGIMTAYFSISEALADDTTEGITPKARFIATGVDRLLETEIPAEPHFWHRHDEVATVRGKALELIDVPDIVEARLKFADLSVALAKLVRATGSWARSCSSASTSGSRCPSPAPPRPRNPASRRHRSRTRRPWHSTNRARNRSTASSRPTWSSRKRSPATRRREPRCSSRPSARARRRCRAQPTSRSRARRNGSPRPRPGNPMTSTRCAMSSRRSPTR
jgi:multidrug efflux pump subunit AcrA (membrane-fusion protein)